MTDAVLSPDETRLLSIWGLLGKRRVSILRWSAAIFFAALAWLGGLAVISQFRRNEVWSQLSALGSHSQVYLICLGASATAAVIALLARQRAIAALGLAATAFLGVFWVSGLLYRLYDPDVSFPMTGMSDALGFAIHRLWWGIPAFVLLGAAALIFGAAPGEPRPHLGFGNWNVEARDVSAKEKPYPYWRRLFVGFVIASIVIFVCLQATVGFRPILSGKFIALLPGILLVALVNSTVEEMVFRGFMQPAFVRVLGAGGGIWTASALFGIVHWGISVGVLAALPVSLAIALGSVVWGKAAYDTKGLGWPIAAHFLIDIAVMGAFFV